jgi:hypothetical protein
VVNKKRNVMMSLSSLRGSGSSGSQISKSLVYSSEQRLKMLSPKPIGFNYYSLVYETLINYTVAIATRSILLDYIVSCGANIVRFAIPVFSSGEYLTLVHNTGTMPATMLDSNLRPSYVAALDSCMNDLASRGLKAHVSDFWGPNYLPGAFGETNVQAYGSLTSATTTYAKSAVAWFFSRYSTHAAFGVYGFGNEYYTDPAGVANPTDAQLGAWFSTLATVARSLDNTKLLTANITSLAVSNASTRKTLDQFATSLKLIFKDLDAYCLHIYGTGYNYVGCQAQEDAAFPNSAATDLGYEGYPALMEAFKAIADAENKPFIVGEFGVPTTEENDTDYVKKNRALKAVSAYSDYGMVWNLQNSTLGASIGNQAMWYIAPGTTRGDTYLKLISQSNRAKPPATPVAGGVDSLRRNLQPKYCIKAARAADASIKFTSTANHASSAGYSILFWLRLDLPLNAGEGLIGFTGTNLYGLGVVAPQTGSNLQTFYIDTRNASGSAGNTVGFFPDFGIGDWNHIAFTSEGVNGSACMRMYINGIYFRSIAVAGYPASIPAAIPLYIGGGNNNYGAPISIQDFCLATSIGPNDVSRHMRGEVLSQALMHVRAYPNKSIADISRFSTPYTSLGSNGITVVQT